MEGLLLLIFLFGHVQPQSMGSNMGLGFNMGLGYPVVNPYLPGVGGGFNIFSGMNRNEEPTSPYVKQVFIILGMLLKCSTLLVSGLVQLSPGGGEGVRGEDHRRLQEVRRHQDDGLQLDHRGDGAPGWCLQVNDVQLEAEIYVLGVAR